MMAEHVEGFINGLIEWTKEKKIEWKSFAQLNIKNDVIEELENGRGGFDYGCNSIRLSSSYYFTRKGGYVFLFDIYHGDPDVTSPQMDSIGLCIKINPALPLECLSDYTEEEQRLLEQLKLLIDNYFEEKYTYPDAIYQFMYDVFSEE